MGIYPGYSKTLFKMSGKSAFNEDQIAEFQEVFTLFDTVGDGMIPTTQVGEVLRALNTNPTEAEVKRLVQDQKADGRISFETFLPILQAFPPKNLPTQLKTLSRVFVILIKTETGAFLPL